MKREEEQKGKNEISDYALKIKNNLIQEMKEKEQKGDESLKKDRERDSNTIHVKNDRLQREEGRHCSLQGVHLKRQVQARKEETRLRLE